MRSDKRRPVSGALENLPPLLEVPMRGSSRRGSRHRRLYSELPYRPLPLATNEVCRNPAK